MNHVDALIDAYKRFVQLPWDRSLAPAQRVWIAVYDPEYERRVRRHLPEFEIATKQAGHAWELVDLTGRFERWMASHEYRDAYFERPELLTATLPEFLDALIGEVRAELSAVNVDDQTVVGLLGAGTLFGLGEQIRTSALLDRVSDAITGRLLVLFPGHHEGNNYRLLDAKDGWNYLATPITATGGTP